MIAKQHLMTLRSQLSRISLTLWILPPSIFSTNWKDMKRFISIIIISVGLLPLEAQNDYYIKQAQSYQREAKYHTKQVLGYELEADFYNRQAQGYLRVAEYYSKRKNYDNAKTYQQRAHNATDKAENYARKARKASVRSRLHEKG